MAHKVFTVEKYAYNCFSFSSGDTLIFFQGSTEPEMNDMFIALQRRTYSVYISVYAIYLVHICWWYSLIYRLLLTTWVERSSRLFLYTLLDSSVQLPEFVLCNAELATVTLLPTNHHTFLFPYISLIFPGFRRVRLPYFSKESRAVLLKWKHHGESTDQKE